MIKIDYLHSMPGLNLFFKQAACLAVSSLVFLFASTVWAQDFILGEVTQVKSDRSGFTLLLDESPDTDDNRLVQVVTGKEQAHWPECVQVGERIRVWGDYVEGEGMMFRAEQVRGASWGRDRSGVRGRLDRGRSGQQGMGPGMGPGNGPGMGPGSRGRNH